MPREAYIETIGLLLHPCMRCKPTIQHGGRPTSPRSFGGQCTRWRPQSRNGLTGNDALQRTSHTCTKTQNWLMAMVRRKIITGLTLNGLNMDQSQGGGGVQPMRTAPSRNMSQPYKFRNAFSHSGAFFTHSHLLAKFDHLCCSAQLEVWILAAAQFILGTNREWRPNITHPT